MQRQSGARYRWSFRRTLGSAYGIVVAIQNIGLASAPLIVGQIRDKTEHGFFWTFAFFIAINIVGFAANLALYCIDVRKLNGRLDKPVMI